MVEYCFGTTVTVTDEFQRFPAGSQIKWESRVQASQGIFSFNTRVSLIKLEFLLGFPALLPSTETTRRAV